MQIKGGGIGEQEEVMLLLAIQLFVFGIYPPVVDMPAEHVFLKSGSEEIALCCRIIIPRCRADHPTVTL